MCDKETYLYICEPSKHTKCKKTNCGECTHTTKEKYAKYKEHIFKEITKNEDTTIYEELEPVVLDDKFLEKIKSLKEYCNENCNECKFGVRTGRNLNSCQIRMLVWEMDNSPKEWNINEIEVIVKQ